jgi:hypothetical protein
MTMIYTSIIANILIIPKRFSGGYGFVIEIGCFIGETTRWISDKWDWRLEIGNIGFSLTGCIRGCLIES